MYQSLLILGRQPPISLAELESIFGANNLLPYGQTTALINQPYQEVRLDCLGGTLKVCQVLAQTQTTSWNSVAELVSDEVIKLTSTLPAGKINLGFSVYGLTTNPRTLSATGLQIKNKLRAENRSVRIIPNKTITLNTAQVIYNKLTSTLGLEIVIASNGQNCIIAKTRQIQNINAYASRDQKRPKRDARVGMLPPKLAQSIINLASPHQQQKVLDPFCGTGVILQEALIMGHDAYGTDINKKMIDYAKINLDWLGERPEFSKLKQSYLLEVGDSCSFSWQIFDTIATETYLGSPFSTEPNQERLKKVINDANTIIAKFLQNVAKQTKPGFRMCLAVPAWFTKNGLKRLPVLDRLTDMGYTRISFVHTQDKDLIYHRDNQIVGRELVILARK